MKCAIYPRVSREEQIQGYSLDAQVSACQAYAETQGWQVTHIYTELGVTGTSDRRPAFQAMISAALAGEFDVILVHKFDRLARNRFDAVLYKSMLRQQSVAVISVTEPSAEDGPAGMLVEGMLEVVAEWYSINLAAEVRKGFQRKAANGEPVGPVPVGYQREAGSSWVEVTEMGAKLNDAFQLFATGQYSLRDWANIAYLRNFKSRAGNKITASGWQTIFRNKFYIGVITYDGHEYRGKHAPVVDEDTFMKVQAILDGRPGGGHQQRRREYLLSGLLWSADYQVSMVGTTAKQRYRYYRAKKEGWPELLIPEYVAENQIVSQLHHIVVNGADLGHFPADLRLALQVAPTVGIVYDALVAPTAKHILLSGVVSRVVVAGRDVDSLELRPGFRVQFDSDRSEPPDSNPNPFLCQNILSLALYADAVS